MPKKTQRKEPIPSPDTRDDWPRPVGRTGEKLNLTLTEKICHRIENLEDRAREAEVWRQNHEIKNEKERIMVDFKLPDILVGGLKRETTRGTALPPKFWQPTCDHRDANEWAENIEDLIEKLITSVGVHYQDTPDHVRRAALELAAAWDAETEEGEDD